MPAGSGSLTFSNEADRSFPFRASFLETFSWARIASVTCSPQENTGFSELIGSWKIMAISLPRMRCIRAGLCFSRSIGVVSLFLSLGSFRSTRSRVNRISPDKYFAGGVGNNCRMDKEVIDFPDPDSPTSATNSPRFTSRSIPYTPGDRTPSVTKPMLILRIDRRGHLGRKM